MKQANDNLTIINDLQKEIQCLKNILDREGISYQEELAQLTNTETRYFYSDSSADRLPFLRVLPPVQQPSLFQKESHK